MPSLVLIRGLPGSGKSTIARGMKGFIHVEADMYFEQSDQYRFDPIKLNEAHSYCLERTRSVLAEGKNVVVSNTFVRIGEMAPYFQLGVPVKVIEANGKFANMHGVNKEIVAAMSNEWEDLPKEWGGEKAMNEVAVDAVSFWEDIVRCLPRIDSLSFFRYRSPLPLQMRLTESKVGKGVIGSAIDSAQAHHLPFWDSVITEAAMSGGLTAQLLDAASFSNPMTIVKIAINRETILAGGLRTYIGSVEPAEIVGILSEATLIDGRVMHFPMMDFRADSHFPDLDAYSIITKYLLPEGATLFKTNKGFHAVGNQLIDAHDLNNFLIKSLFLGPIVDRKYVAHHLQRGFCTLRISATNTTSAPFIVGRA